MLCQRCKEDKPETEFNWKNKSIGQRQKFCRDCKSVYQRDWYHRHREEHIKKVKVNSRRYMSESQAFIVQYLRTHPCVDCGEVDILVLEFHHRDPSQKERNISHALHNGHSIESLKQEIIKCDVVCANCHARRHPAQYKMGA